MAGPGGGPPRKSHTKSRKGCKTCKKRHIRCDENFPQCRNCTKHSCVCDYKHNPPPSDEPSVSQGPNLLWTRPIEGAIEAWRQTGIIPLPNLGLHSGRQFQGLSREDLRLVYHLLSIHQDLQRVNLSQCTVWVQELPSFLNAADGYGFVMSAILAFAATHLAWLTHSTETKNLAYHHRGTALKGLHDAIGQFSRENSDAILAASILLSWQTSDWSGWNSLMQGIATVLSSMDSWRETSVFASFIGTHPSFFSARPLAQTLAFADDQALVAAINGLQRLSEKLVKNQAATGLLKDLCDFAQSVQSYSTTMQSEHIFGRLQPLRAWLFWTPIAFLSTDGVKATDLVVLAQLYSVALAVDTSFPELRGAALGSLTARQIEQIDYRLRYDSPTMTELGFAGVQEAMHFPRTMASRHRLESTGNPGRTQARQAGHQSPYGMQHLSIASTPNTPGFPPGTPLGLPMGFSGPLPTMLNPSVEDLSTPASPFLRYGTPASRRHSLLMEASPKVYDESFFDGRSMTGYSFRGDSPAYSSSFHEDDHSAIFRSHSPAGYPGEFVAPIPWA
ncbi:MAG: hypothetical protein Q9223_000074 [Gallowayella weberi]